MQHPFGSSQPRTEYQGDGQRARRNHERDRLGNTAHPQCGKSESRQCRCERYRVHRGRPFRLSTREDPRLDTRTRTRRGVPVENRHEEHVVAEPERRSRPHRGLRVGCALQLVVAHRGEDETGAKQRECGSDEPLPRPPAVRSPAGGSHGHESDDGESDGRIHGRGGGLLPGRLRETRVQRQDEEPVAHSRQHDHAGEHIQAEANDRPQRHRLEARHRHDDRDAQEESAQLQKLEEARCVGTPWVDGGQVPRVVRLRRKHTPADSGDEEPESPFTSVGPYAEHDRKHQCHRYRQEVSSVSLSCTLVAGGRAE